MDKNKIQQGISQSRAVPVDPEYDKFVDAAATSKDPTTLQNDSTSCALSVFRSVAKHAVSSIDVFSGNLDPQVFDDDGLDKNLQDFLYVRKGTLRILIQNIEEFDKIAPAPLIFQHISSHPNVEVAFLPLTNGSRDLSHFAVADSSTYRLEVSASEHQALVSFNDPESSLKLHGFFNALWERSTPLPKPSSCLVGESAVAIPAVKS